MRALLVIGALAVVVVAGAAGAEQPLPPLAERCQEDSVEAEVFYFRSTDGRRLDGAVLGSGTAGVVLSHQLQGEICQWLPFARVLADEGFLVLLFDHRGVARSAPLAGGAGDGRLDRDVAGAATELRRRGAVKVALVGASLGGAAVLAAGATARPAPAAIVSVSPPNVKTLRLAAPQWAVLNPDRAVTRSRVPTLFIAAKLDGSFAAEARALYKASRAPQKRLVVVPGFSHGVGMLSFGAEGRKMRALVIGFLRAHT